MVLDTKHFGSIEIEDSKIITFKHGLPGFQDLTRFALLAESDAEKENPFFWLQSVDDPQTAFVMMDVIKFFPEYDPLVDRSLVEGELGEYDPGHYYIYNIANIPSNIKDMTVNLKAPVVINDELKRGMQIICDNDEYSVKHFVFK